MIDLPFSEEEYYARMDNEDRCATIPEAISEWARNVGRDNQDRQWLLSDYDTWERNPFYTGPDQGHPEDDQWVGAEDRDLDFMDEEYPKDDEYDGQPDEAQEWHDFDPDC